MTVSEDRGHVIYCSRCGAEMYSNARYCMKCGNINYEHEENESMVDFKPEEAKEESKGKYLLFGQVDTSRISSGDHTGNPKMPFLLILIIYFALLVLTALLSFMGGARDLLSFAQSPFYIVAIVGGIVAIYNYAMCLIFMKTNRPWWAGLIPFYNLFGLADIVFGKSILGVLFFIPFVNIIFCLLLFYQLGVQFQFNGVLTALFSGIMVPVIGYSNHAYMKCPIVNEKEHSIENTYKRKQNFLSLTCLFIFVGIGFFVYANYTSGSNLSSYGNFYYIYTTNKLVEQIRENLSAKKVSCSDTTFSKENGTYYFYFRDVGDDVVLPLYVLRDPITAYVKVEYRSGEPKYYVSMSDGTRGYKETLYEDITLSTVGEFINLKYHSGSVNECSFE